MLKYFLLHAIGIITFIPVTRAQQADDTEFKKKENFLYISPVNLFMKTLELGYEKKLKNHNTVVLFAGFKLSKDQQVTENIGGNGEIQYRINLLYNKEAISLVSKNYTTFAYFAPYFNYRYEEITESANLDVQPTNSTASINVYFGGAGFGFRISGRENRFTVNFFAGGGLRYAIVNGSDVSTDFLQAGYTGIAPKAGFQMGIAF